MTMKPRPTRQAPQSLSEDDWINSAPSKEPYPWEGQHVRDDLRKPTNISLSERMLLQIAYMVNHPRKGGPTTIRALAVEALERYLQGEMEQRGIPEDRR